MTSISSDNSLPKSFRQSRSLSFLEATTNVVLGFVLAFVVQGVIYPPLGIRTTPQDEFVIALVFTAVSLLRSYLLRRAFEAVREA